MFEIVGQLLIGWLIADIVSGFAHFLEDNLDIEHWPVIGPLIIAPNRRHHDRPLAFARDGFLSRNGTTWLAALPLVAIWFWVAGFSFVWLSASIGMLMASQIHYWAHVPSAPLPVRAAQATGFFTSPAVHYRHHRPPHACGYCVVSGWLNPWLDAVRFWTVPAALMPRVSAL